MTVLFEGASTLSRTLPTWIAALRECGVACILIDNSESANVEHVVKGLDWGPVDLTYTKRSNPGFAASANEAIALATTPWVFLLNPDVYISTSNLRSVLRHLETKRGPGPHSSTAVSLVTNGEHTCGIYLDRLGYFSDRPQESRRVCLGPSGGAGLFDRKNFLSYGGFDDDLFAWGEDAGLAIRMYSNGVRTDQLILGLEHEGGHSVASLPGQRIKARLLSRNRILILRRNFDAPFIATVGVLQIGLILTNGLRKIALGTGRQHFRGLLEGLRAPRLREEKALRMSLSQFLRYQRSWSQPRS